MRACTVACMSEWGLLQIGSRPSLSERFGIRMLVRMATSVSMYCRTCQQAGSSTRPDYASVVEGNLLRFLHVCVCLIKVCSGMSCWSSVLLRSAFCRFHLFPCMAADVRETLFCRIDLSASSTHTSSSCSFLCGTREKIRWQEALPHFSEALAKEICSSVFVFCQLYCHLCGQLSGCNRWSPALTLEQLFLSIASLLTVSFGILLEFSK